MLVADKPLYGVLGTEGNQKSESKQEVISMNVYFKRHCFPVFVFLYIMKKANLDTFVKMSVGYIHVTER